MLLGKKTFGRARVINITVRIIYDLCLGFAWSQFVGNLKSLLETPVYLQDFFVVKLG